MRWDGNGTDTWGSESDSLSAPGKVSEQTAASSWSAAEASLASAAGRVEEMPPGMPPYCPVASTVSTKSVECAKPQHATQATAATSLAASPLPSWASARSAQTPSEAASSTTVPEYWQQSHEPLRSSGQEQSYTGWERPVWLEVKEGWDYCSLCRLFATDGHLKSEKHKYRVEMYEWEHSDASHNPEGPPESWGDPSYFEWRDGWHWWCKLCHQWSNGGHVQGKRHQKRVQWENWVDEDNPWDKTKWAGPAVDSDDDTGTPSTASKLTLDPWGPEWESRSGASDSSVAASKKTSQHDEGSSHTVPVAHEPLAEVGDIEWC